MALGVAFVGLVLFAAIAALSHEHERAFSASIVYLGCGLLASVGIGLLGLERIDPVRDELVLQRVAELAIVTAVFAAGLAVERASRRSWTRVLVLLAVVMPVSIALVALFAGQVMGLSLAAAVLLGATLCPTDPVLAGSVGLSAPGEHADQQGEPRFSLHTEAGINDGLASPFVVLGLFLAEEGGLGWLGEWALVDLVYAAGLAAVVGLLAGRALARGAVRLRERELLAPELDGFVALAAALLVYGVVQAVDAYGFLAVFAAGFAFRRYEFEHELNRGVHDGADRVKTFLELAVLLLLGSTVTLTALEVPGLAGWLLAPLLIVVIRPVLVALLIRGDMTPRARAFLAVFGVRGVAALYYATLIVHADVLDPGEEAVLFWTTVAVVMVSVVVHGVLATPLTRRLL